ARASAPARRGGRAADGVAASVFVAGDGCDDALSVAPDRTWSESGALAGRAAPSLPPDGAAAAVAPSGTSCPPGFAPASLMMRVAESASTFRGAAEAVAPAGLPP